MLEFTYSSIHLLDDSNLRTNSLLSISTSNSTAAPINMPYIRTSSTCNRPHLTVQERRYHANKFQQKSLLNRNSSFPTEMIATSQSLKRPCRYKKRESQRNLLSRRNSLESQRGRNHDHTEISRSPIQYLSRNQETRKNFVKSEKNGRDNTHQRSFSTVCQSGNSCQNNKNIPRDDFEFDLERSMHAKCRNITLGTVFCPGHSFGKPNQVTDLGRKNLTGRNRNLTRNYSDISSNSNRNYQRDHNNRDQGCQFTIIPKFCHINKKSNWGKNLFSNRRRSVRITEVKSNSGSNENLNTLNSLKNSRRTQSFKSHNQDGPIKPDSDNNFKLIKESNRSSYKKTNIGPLLVKSKIIIPSNLGGSKRNKDSFRTTRQTSLSTGRNESDRKNKNNSNSNYQNNSQFLLRKVSQRKKSLEKNPSEHPKSINAKTNNKFSKTNRTESRESNVTSSTVKTKSKAFRKMSFKRFWNRTQSSENDELHSEQTDRFDELFENETNIERSFSSVIPTAGSIPILFKNNRSLKESKKISRSKNSFEQNQREFEYNDGDIQIKFIEKRQKSASELEVESRKIQTVQRSSGSIFGGGIICSLLHYFILEFQSILYLSCFLISIIQNTIPLISNTIPLRCLV